MMELFCLNFFMALFLCLIFSLFMENYFISNQKSMEFECGFNTIILNRLSFSLQYFLISILFLVFDLEIILIMPIIESSFKTFTVLNMLLLLMMILTLGLLIEWIYGMVDWSK